MAPVAPTVTSLTPTGTTTFAFALIQWSIPPVGTGGWDQPQTAFQVETWTGPDGGRTYQFSTGLVANPTDRSYSGIPLRIGVNTRVRVRALSGDSVWSDWAEPTSTIFRIPTDPVITTPSGTTATVTDPFMTLAWTAAFQTTYRVEVRTAANGGGSLEWATEVASTAKTLSVPLPNNGVTRYVRVRVADSGTWSANYDEVAVTTNFVQTPVITAPAANASFAPTTQTVTWTTPYQQNYEVLVVNATSGATEWTSGVVASTNTSVTASFPTPGPKDIKVRSQYGGVWSDYGVRRVTRSDVPTPVLTAPTDGGSSPLNTQTISWTTSYQENYEVRVLSNTGSVDWTSGQVANSATRSVVASLPNLGTKTIDVRTFYGSAWSPRGSVAFTRTTPPAPVISGPADNASLTTNSHNLTWTTAITQDAYEVEVLAGATTTYASGTVVSSSKSVALSLPNAGTYALRVRYRYSGDWSAWTSITVTRVAPAAPDITAPADNATFSTVAQTLTWTAAVQSAYEARIKHAATGAVEWTSGVVEGTAKTRAISFPNLGTKTLEVRVRDESVWSDWDAVTGVYVSPTPVITSLTGGVIAASAEPLVGGHSTPFEGDDYQSAVESRWRIVGDSTWTTGATQSGAQNLYTYPTTLAVGNYERQVRVRLNATGEWSPWSASGLFTLFARPPVPQIVVPLANMNVADRVNVTWTAPSQADYEVQVRDGNTVEWTSGVVANAATRTVQVQFPTLGNRQVYLRTRTNTLWSNEGAGAWATLNLVSVATPVTSLDRVIDPFKAASSGYDTVTLSWTPPLATAWSGYRIVRSKSGFPVTADDGISVTEVIGGTWSDNTGHVVSGLTGGWHYFAFFLSKVDGSGWVRVAETDILIPYDYASTDKLWDTMPEYYRMIRDDTAFRSLRNERINPMLYLSGEESVPNLPLSNLLSLFGVGFDYLRTENELVASGYDAGVVHVSRLGMLAKQFGRDLEQSVPAYANRTAVRNLANMYRKRGTVEGIKDLVTMATGWDVEVTLGNNLMLSDDQAALTNPSYEQWMPTRYYTVGNRVQYGSYIFTNLVAARGEAQAPPPSGVSNTWWSVVDVPSTDRTLLNPLTDDVSTWQAAFAPGPGAEGVVAGKTAIGVGVQNPVSTLLYQSNALELVRTTSDGSTSLVAFSVPRLAKTGVTVDPKQFVLENGIPLPQAVPYVAGTTYRAGTLVSNLTYIYEALVDTSVAPALGTDWKRVSAAGAQPTYRLSVYAHGPFSGTAGTGGRVITLAVKQYDASGTIIGSTLTGSDSGSVSTGAVGAAWTRPYFTFTPAANARYLSVGAIIASPALNEKQYLTNWMLERPSTAVSTPSPYQKAREVGVIVRPDRVNMWANPRGVNNALVNMFQMRYSWTRSGLTGLSGAPDGITTAIRATAPAAPPAGRVGIDLITNPDLGAPAAGPLLNSLPVVPGRVYTLSGWVRASWATTLGAIIRFHDGTNWVGARVDGAVAAGTANGWKRVYVTTIAPVGAKAAAGEFFGGSGYVEGSAFDTTGVMFENGDLDTYFDGSKGTDYIWEEGTTADTGRSFYYRNRVDRAVSMTRAMSDAVPLGIGAGTPRFGVWLP